jgi:hypothetical protein
MVRLYCFSTQRIPHTYTSAYRAHPHTETNKIVKHTVPDIAVVRPESAANFVEQMAQVVIRCDIADPSVEETVDNGIKLIVHRFPD